MKVLVCTPAFGGLLTVPYFLSFLNTAVSAAESGVSLGVYTITNDSLIPRARNRCVAQALKDKVDKLFFIDADVSWSWQQAAALISSERPIVGGLYPQKCYPITMNFNPLPEHLHYFNQGRSPEAFAKFGEEADDRGEVSVRHLPTGFLMIDCSVFEKLKPFVQRYPYEDALTKEPETHWEFFRSGTDLRGEFQSEDWAFCELAKCAGYDLTLNVNCIVDHTGSHTFSGNQ